MYKKDLPLNKQQFVFNIKLNQTNPFNIFKCIFIPPKKKRNNENMQSFLSYGNIQLIFQLDVCLILIEHWILKACQTI